MNSVKYFHHNEENIENLKMQLGSNDKNNNINIIPFLT